MSAVSLGEPTDDLLTIDELAMAVGLTVRTTRYYASLGLIPPPERRGVWATTARSTGPGSS
jgi:MerR family regulatory protein